MPVDAMNIPDDKATPPRIYALEKQHAKDRRIERISSIAHDRAAGRLGDDIIKVATALLFCSLPYSRPEYDRFERRARMGRNQVLRVSFMTANPAIGLPFGRDRRFLFWCVDQAIRRNDPFVPFGHVAEYLRDVGLKKGGGRYADLAATYRRISELMVRVEHMQVNATSEDPEEGTSPTKRYAIFEESYLPASIDPNSKQTVLPSLERHIGIRFNPSFFAEVKRRGGHRILPRRLWLDLKGSPQVQDIVFWLYARCYAADSESIIPWDDLKDQFPTDSNPRRLKQQARHAIEVLQNTWSGVIQVAERPAGIFVDRPLHPLMPDDVSKRRVYVA